MKEIGRHYPDCGYGGKFRRWIFGEDAKPYNSYGNGSAMRVSFVGEYFEQLDDVIREAGKNGGSEPMIIPEGIKGAVTTAVCIWMAKHGKTKDEIYRLMC